MNGNPNDTLGDRMKRYERVRLASLIADVERLTRELGEARAVGPKLVAIPNADAGDANIQCDCCLKDLDEPHSWRECAEYLRDDRARIDDAYWDLAHKLDEMTAERDAMLAALAPAMEAAKGATEGAWRAGSVETDAVFVPHPEGMAGLGGERVVLRANPHFPFADDMRFVAAACNAVRACAAIRAGKDS